MPSLDAFFKVGQYVRANVTALHLVGTSTPAALEGWKPKDEMERSCRRVEVTLDPKTVNEGVKKVDLEEGFVSLIRSDLWRARDQELTTLRAVASCISACLLPSKASRTTDTSLTSDCRTCRGSCRSRTPRSSPRTQSPKMVSPRRLRIDRSRLPLTHRHRSRLVHRQAPPDRTVDRLLCPQDGREQANVHLHRLRHQARHLIREHPCLLQLL